MTEAKAIDTDKIEATFASDVPADTEITVTKDGANIDGTATKEGAKATFVSKSKFAVGTYTITAKLGDATVSKEVVVSAEHVEEIKVTSTQALLKADGKKKTAIVYYDVYNQYAVSMRNSVSVTWTASSGTVKANKSTGRLEITKSDATEFTYGQKLYLVGVDAKSGKTAQAEVSIGLEQAIDSIEFVGFLNTKADTPKEVKDLAQGLPANFQANTYVMLYTVKDQDGQVMDAANDNITNASGAALTFTADNPMVLDGSKIKDGSVYTIDGVEYSSATMEPGMYADQGGEVNLMAISNKTGKQTKINFTVGEAARLKTFSISAPSKTVADGDEWVSIPFEATDVNGKSVKNYETIVRSTNSLSLSASGDTELKVKEENDGTAGIYWSDSKTAGDYTESSASDNISRNISLTTVVVGGESNNMMLEVSDMRRPVAIKSVKLNDDNNDAIAVGNNAVIKFKENKNENTIVFLDQYNAELDGDIAARFFKHTSANTFDKGYYYGIKVDVVGENNMGLTDKVYCGENISVAATLAGEKMAENTVRYSIVRAKDKTAAFNGWDDVSSVRTVSYNIIPVNLLKNSAVIKSFAKQELTTSKFKVHQMDQH